MNVKDIVNKDIVNLVNCESEPIHVPGSIQPHGFLLGLTGSNFLITFCSGNTGDFIDKTPQQLLGHTLTQIFTPEEVSRFKEYLANTAQQDIAHPHVFTHDEIQYNTTVHTSGNGVVLEFEPFPDGSLKLPNLYTQTRKFVSFLDTARNLQELCQLIADETRTITGYDRVMIYRFDKDYNGEIFAESKIDSIESFLGLNYPHTDIPVQARQLYMRNLLRMIADVHYTPIPIYTINDNASNKDLDLSLSVLRSVSPIHIEYLKNMGVGATLTISLIHDNRLWGLITCHHYSAKNIPHYTRLAAQLQGHFLASQIKVREVAEEFETSMKLNGHLYDLQKLLTGTEDFAVTQCENPLLLTLTNADGVAIVSEGNVCTGGIVPADEEILKLGDWLHTYADTGNFHTSRLSDIYEDGKAIAAKAAGIMYRALGTTSVPNYIIWFRSEVENTINWAGDPAKAIIKDSTGLSPRKSFELWKEVVKHQSREWSIPEVNAASSFAHNLQKQLYITYIRREEDKYRKLSEQLQEANNELANINWISTHDLKEPLRKIQIFSSRLLETNSLDLSADTVRDSITRVKNAAGRMQVLIDDILEYFRLNDDENPFVPVNLNDIIATVRAELSEEIDEKSTVMEVDTLPVVNGVPFQIRQLFINLLGNALKFAKPGERPHINITCSRVHGKSIKDKNAEQEDYYQICFKDSGIGFDTIYVDKIFDVFQRLHTSNSYGGTGVGLAICKKIMNNHKGFITAHSIPNDGATFCVYFPV